MVSRLRAQVYDVDVRPVKMDIEEDVKREYVEDGKIKIQTKVKVIDSIDVKESAESKADGKIKPYGLEAESGAYDVEVKEKVEPTVIEEHIDKAVKKETRKKSK